MDPIKISDESGKRKAYRDMRCHSAGKSSVEVFLIEAGRSYFADLPFCTGLPPCVPTTQGLYHPPSPNQVLNALVSLASSSFGSKL